MRYYIFTLGCQMNESDSERIVKILDSMGAKSASEKEADLIIVNACSVRQAAVDRIHGKLKLWLKAKPKKTVIITGCLLLIDKNKLAKKVDLIFGIKDLPKLPNLLAELGNIKLEKKTGCVKNYFGIKPKRENSKIAYISIMTGCDHFCTYCAVPYVRGREYSRPGREILKEVKEALKKGAGDIILLGQNVNRYKPSFVDLSKKIVKIPGSFKIKFISPNPWDLPDELIALITKEPKIAKEIHLPVQSGDDQILRKMNRPYTAKDYLELVKKIRTKIPKIWLSTDIIVGFPGETKKAFQNTVKLAQKARFDKAYIAQYSPRPGTNAAQLKDNVPREEKKRRWKILDEMINNN